LESYELGEQQQQVEAPRKRARPIWLKPLVGFLLFAAVAGASFYGGMSYQKGRQPTVNSANDGQAGQSVPGQQGAGYGPMGGNAQGAMGKVTAISSSSISVEDARTSSATTYSITSSTTITDNGQSASTSDIAVGDSVLVVPNTSQSSQAAQIMLSPQVGGGYGQNAPPST